MLESYLWQVWTSLDVWVSIGTFPGSLLAPMILSFILSCHFHWYLCLRCALHSYLCFSLLYQLNYSDHSLLFLLAQVNTRFMFLLLFLLLFLLATISSGFSLTTFPYLTNTLLSCEPAWTYEQAAKFLKLLEILENERWKPFLSARLDRPSQVWNIKGHLSEQKTDQNKFLCHFYFEQFSETIWSKFFFAKTR